MQDCFNKAIYSRHLNYCDKIYYLLYHHTEIDLDSIYLMNKPSRKKQPPRHLVLLEIHHHLVQNFQQTKPEKQNQKLTSATLLKR